MQSCKIPINLCFLFLAVSSGVLKFFLAARFLLDQYKILNFFLSFCFFLFKVRMFSVSRKGE